MPKKDTETEAKFLEIDLPDTLKRLKKLKAKDLGEKFLDEIIFYDKADTWSTHKRVRLRSNGDKIFLTFKHTISKTISGTKEIEIEVNDFEKTKRFLEAIGLKAVRIQEKKRHTFKYKKVTIDIDTWPKVPTYIEIEGDNVRDIKEAAKDLGFDWSKANFMGAGTLLVELYKIPVFDLKYLTFSKIK